MKIEGRVDECIARDCATSPEEEAAACAAACDRFRAPPGTTFGCPWLYPAAAKSRAIRALGGGGGGIQGGAVLIGTSREASHFVDDWATNYTALWAGTPEGDEGTLGFGADQPPLERVASGVRRPLSSPLKRVL